MKTKAFLWISLAFLGWAIVRHERRLKRLSPYNPYYMVETSEPLEYSASHETLEMSYIPNPLASMERSMARLKYLMEVDEEEVR